MKWTDLNRVTEAPPKGMLLAYMRKEVVFYEYSSLAEVEKSLFNQDVMEIHLFDERKEYRALATQSPRFPEHYIENVFVSEENEEKNVYIQNFLLEKKGTLQVKNWISYNEYGMAVVGNYQLVKED